MFVDRIQIPCRAGKGGDGSIAWRREKYIPKGGPAGGDGGNGGSIIFEADHNVFSLDYFTHCHRIVAQNGDRGGSACRTGKNGTDELIKIPCGTLLKDLTTGEVLFDFVSHKDRFVVCKGGRGGKGNFHFRTPTNRAPNKATMGLEGEEREIELELKLVADIGLIGFPNAGKSTLIKHMCGASVEIAPYPFTTMRPNLGSIRSQEAKLFLADIPGLIEGAHRGRGLGFEFLRHIERTRALIFVLDATGITGSPLDHFAILQKELAAYDSRLLKRPFLVVLNKCDEASSEEHIEQFLEVYKEAHVISAEQRIGLEKVEKECFKLLSDGTMLQRSFLNT